MSHWYFAYGSNMNPDRVRTRGVGFDAILGGQLRGFQLVFNKRSVKYPRAASANVMEKPGFKVEGLLYRMRDEADIESMDPYEGYPLRYNRYKLPIVVQESIEPAWVYTANENYRENGLKPASWYLQHLLKGEQYLSPGYLEQLKQVECLPGSEVEGSDIEAG